MRNKPGKGYYIFTAGLNERAVLMYNALSPVPPNDKDCKLLFFYQNISIFVSVSIKNVYEKQ